MSLSGATEPTAELNGAETASVPRTAWWESSAQASPAAVTALVRCAARQTLPSFSLGTIGTRSTTSRHAHLKRFEPEGDLGSWLASCFAFCRSYSAGGRGQVGKAKRMRSARPAGRAGAEKCHAQASGRVVHVFSVTACISTPEGVCWFKKEITCPGKLFCRMWP